MKKRIGIFGGRFDPVHNGHLAVAKEILHVGAADEVWFSIENKHQWRPIVALTDTRRAMIELAIQGESSMKIDDTPSRLGGITETISVIRDLRKHTTDDLFFIVGSDQPFDKWTHWDALEKEVHFLIIQRKGFSMKTIPRNATVIDDPTYEPLEDSATRIRDLLKQGYTITGLVPKKIEEYIQEHKLYTY